MPDFHLVDQLTGAVLRGSQNWFHELHFMTCNLSETQNKVKQIKKKYTRRKMHFCKCFMLLKKN